MGKQQRDRARFVCQMEDVLDVYHAEYSEEFPLICMDQASKQLQSAIAAWQALTHNNKSAFLKSPSRLRRP